ncbi:unnamed protein product [Adineta steineri]|uniref:cysteine dioxygenase n=1 Tax=Adineta steineri TaxID=433720 RepID=A0A819MEI6_9BILA|nr:unnamed protein product [Adineta steineri]
MIFFIEGSFQSSAKTLIAEADIHIDSSPVSIGTLTFTQRDFPPAPVRISGTLKNLIPNTRYHGFHVHTFALTEGDWNCNHVGAHWNPFNTRHGDRLDSIDRRHVGDLGNILSDSFGNVYIDFEDSIIQLHNLTKSSILNKSIVIHKDNDDLGRGNHDDSHTTGHAGALIACGNIRLLDSVSTSKSAINILWPFDLNTKDFYNIYNGVPLSSVSYVSSPVSTTAVHLRSSLKQSIAVTQPSLNLTRLSFTVQCWIHPTSLSTYHNTILAQCQNPSLRNCLHMGIRNTTLYMNYYDETLQSKSILKPDNWYHVAFVFDSVSLQLSIYLNGKQDVTKKVSVSNYGTTDSITIGTSYITRQHHTHFDGYIDQLSIVSSARSAEDILRDATSIQSTTIKEPMENSNVIVDSSLSTNCQTQNEIIQQQAKVIEQQITMTKNVLQMSMETVSQMWNQQQDQRVCKSNIQSLPSHYDYTPPNRVWCPWKEDCTQILDNRGRLTIEMDQQLSVPFELHMSISEQPINRSYIVHFSIDERQVSIYKTINNITTSIHQTTNKDHILYGEKGKYWLSIDYANLFVKYGQGEVRDRCTLIKTDVPNSEQDYIRSIKYAHISFNNSREIAHLKKFENKIRMKVGKNPVVDDPALLVITPDQFTIDHQQNNTVIPITRLDSHCQALYHDVIHWRFQDDDFPYLYEAIEYSISNNKGWCHQKLIEKASRFGGRNLRATYLRITIGRNRGTSPGVPYVLEVWPPGHFSPIHSHGNTYGIIRVLHGEVNVKLYRTLNLKKKEPIHEATIYENQVTWLSPGLNQVHKLENKSPNKSCITIQAYEYVANDVTNYEYFDYITNDGQDIKVFDPVSDIDYFEFKKIIMEEWNNKH